MGKQKTDKKAPVNQFAIYEIVMVEAQQTLISPIMDSQTALNKSAEILKKYFSGHTLHLYRQVKKNGETESEIYPNDILCGHDNVCLLRVNNNRKQKVVEKAQTTTNGIADYVENVYTSNPYCYVVIDNRAEKGICQMAIQKNSAWGEPNNVRKLLEDNINRWLVEERIPLDLTISAKMRPSKIWEFCQQRCTEGKDSIQRISFEFPNQKKISQNQRIENPKGYVKQLAKIMELTDAFKTHISMEYTDADPDKLEKQANDLANIVRVCHNKSYNLSILFKSYGLYRCDDQVRAMFPMDERLLNAFRLNWEDLEGLGDKYGLFEWCNYVYEQSKLYDNVEKTPAKRGRRH